ncbi:MAG: ATP-dependent Clp protease proteolytic subunit [Planctomycetota bacterium]|jgi:ATP-dependent Clp protease protease subunit
MSTLVPIVIEKTGRGERSYDIFSRLLNDRIVFVGGGINDEIANLVVAQLLFLANEDPKADVNLYVNSPGGSVTAGLGIIDTMNFIPCDVATFIIGQAASMGSLIACSGAAGKRFALPHAKNLMHQPMLAGVLEGQATDLEIEAREMLRLRSIIFDVYVRATGQSKERVAEDCERNKWLDAKEMVDYGLADTVLEHLAVDPSKAAASKNGEEA